ncbi:MAG: hypothetical protein ACI4GZ_04760 [Ruminococcus sp.]
MQSKIEAMFSILLYRKASENGVSVIAAIPLLLSDVIPEEMNPLLCEEYGISLPEGATFLDALNIATKKARSTGND